MLRTRFTELFGLEHPIMSAPMTLHVGAGLAAAVSEAGGMGSLPGINATADPKQLAHDIAELRSRTARPFAIGFITPFLPMLEPLFQVALEAQPALIAFHYGDPRPWISRCQDAGIAVACQVQTVEQADAAAVAGADLLVAQGSEAGGHTGRRPVLALLGELVHRHPQLPVLAAGGIGDGPSLATALRAGAEGAWVGTAFLATPEVTEIDDVHKQLIVASDGTDTVLTRAYDLTSPFPWPAESVQRVRRNAFTDEWAGRESELLTACVLPDPSSLDSREIMYGESAGLVPAVRPAADVLREISAAAEQLMP